MAELIKQSKVAELNSNSQTKKPRWGKRILENLRIAGAATFLAGSLALSGCGKAHLQPVIPSISNRVVCDPKLGTIYFRPDGGNAILSRPTDIGQDHVCCYAVPLLALALTYGTERKEQ